MAPFKLKFRMGGLRSTSQEANDTDPQNNYNENLTNNSQTNLFQFGSSTTIDSHEVTGGSTGSLNNDQRALLHSGDDGRIGYSNPTLTHTETSNHPVPLSPPPSYETVLEENRLAAIDSDKNPNISCNSFIHTINMHKGDNLAQASKQESIDSSLYSCNSTAATTPSQDINMMTCNGSCDQLYIHQQQAGHEQLDGRDNGNNNNSCSSSNNCMEAEGDDNNGDTITYECDNNSDGMECHTWDDNEQEHSELDHNLHQQRQQQQTLHQQPVQEIVYKSSKELYKAVAKQCGITCKMSDQCRCLDCQSCYFDCEYDQNENEKTDGGLGAGTPMFISEVMHGSACTIL